MGDRKVPIGEQPRTPVDVGDCGKDPIDVRLVVNEPIDTPASPGYERQRRDLVLQRQDVFLRSGLVLTIVCCHDPQRVGALLEGSLAVAHDGLDRTVRVHLRRSKAESGAALVHEVREVELRRRPEVMPCEMGVFRCRGQRPSPAVLSVIAAWLTRSLVPTTRAPRKVPLPNPDITMSPARTVSTGLVEPSAMVIIVPAARH